MLTYDFASSPQLTLLCRKVFEKLCDDFGSKRRERVVRLDVPLRAFDGPASSISNRLGGTRLTAAGTFVGPGGPALSAGLDDICAGLRDSIRAAYEARKAAYEAEVRGWAGCFCACCYQLSDGARQLFASGQRSICFQHRPSGGYLVGLFESDVAYVPSAGAVRVLRSLILFVCGCVPLCRCANFIMTAESLVGASPCCTLSRTVLPLCWRVQDSGERAAGLPETAVNLYETHSRGVPYGSGVKLMRHHR